MPASVADRGTARTEALREAAGLVAPEALAEAEAKIGPEGDGPALAAALLAAGALTKFQAEALGRGAFAELRIGNYDVLGRLGAGGMGTVFKARHRRMKRIVALKVLAKALGQDEIFVQRFQREVETIARLAHPNIVMAYDADEAEAGRFLVMEFVDGEDLTATVQRGPMPVRDAVRAIADAARGLEYAHKQGIVHRDIKPANLLRDVAGMVKVADLGLARLSAARGEDPDHGITQAGGILGTVDFMSPEQAVDSTALGPASDVYSLGATLHFLLAGKPPFQGSSLMATLLMHRDAPVPALRPLRPDVPERLAALTARMLAKKTAERPATMAEVVKELEDIDATLDAAADLGTTVCFKGGLPGLAPDTTTDRAAPTAALRVVAVEPSRTQAAILKSCLEAAGATAVELFATGAEALARLRTGAADAVVSALHLKDMTGVQLAREVRGGAGHGPAPGFVLVSSAADGGESAKSSVAGLAVSLQKPFTADQLAYALGVATNRTLAAKPLAANSAASLAGMTRIGRPPSSLAKKPRELLRVLIADDSAAARIHVRQTLQGLGLRNFVEAPDGAQAVAAAAREPFDLIVTDYNMPFMDGAALVGYLRANPATAKIPIVMVTTETSAEKLDPIRRLNVAGITPKSFPADVVAAILQQVC